MSTVYVLSRTNIEYAGPREGEAELINIYDTRDAAQAVADRANAIERVAKYPNWFYEVEERQVKTKDDTEVVDIS